MLNNISKSIPYLNLKRLISHQIKTGPAKPPIKHNLPSKVALATKPDQFEFKSKPVTLNERLEKQLQMYRLSDEARSTFARPGQKNK